jgi:acyl-CoA thioester hydrolase
MPVEHSVRLRVRFAETDAMQVACYADYFVWFEVARTEVSRSIGLSYSGIRERGVQTPVVRVVADRKASTRYDDEVVVWARASKVERSSIRLD